MPLDNATSGLGGGLPNDRLESETVGGVKGVSTKRLDNVTEDLTDPVLPGGFPSDEASKRNEEAVEISFSAIWSTIAAGLSTLFPQAFDAFESSISGLVCWLLPPPRQAAIYEAALKRPAATTFIVCQIICCGVPLFVFLAGIVVFAAIAILLWALLSLLILGPVLLVTSMMGASLWGWGWIFYGLVKWIDQRFLGGMLIRFWLPRPQSETQSETENGGDQPEEDKKKE
ncbi:hypothetical protein N7471_006676 [Penicillium samsonianum]|uniref:uncharacterized protein n=1 Tax=Penicillium samsonianum TaxID=1882272 RepID=UPI002548ADBE|nr:uncharacterized protein N7471_006676 [Penicillium samsonianum]KAJ6140190.1 hypothetical protein N7471_006676 [Penicillium samsonianum]